jgi:FtsP/CotA-like multicopper oxidase with cupredoxin domain
MLVTSLALALATSAAPPPPDWGTAREVEVRLSSFAFTPPRIQLRAGEPVRLELVNDLLASRSFHAPGFFSAAQVLPADRPRLSGGTVRLKPGERRTIRLVAPARGRYSLRSGRLLQAALGMRGLIVVR